MHNFSLSGYIVWIKDLNMRANKMPINQLSRARLGHLSSRICYCMYNESYNIDYTVFQTVHLSVNMRSPYIVIPEYGTLHRGGNVVVLDLGKLKIESELQPKNLSMKVGENHFIVVIHALRFVRSPRHINYNWFSSRKLRAESHVLVLSGARNFLLLCMVV